MLKETSMYVYFCNCNNLFALSHRTLGYSFFSIQDQYQNVYICNAVFIRCHPAASQMCNQKQTLNQYSFMESSMYAVVSLASNHKRRLLANYENLKFNYYNISCEMQKELQNSYYLGWLTTCQLFQAVNSNEIVIRFEDKMVKIFYI